MLHTEDEPKLEYIETQSLARHLATLQYRQVGTDISSILQAVPVAGITPPKTSSLRGTHTSY